MSVVTTTETIVNYTQTTAATSSLEYLSNFVNRRISFGGIDFYFRWVVVVIGFAGTAANALILYALFASKQHKKHVLIFHQNVIDFVSCVFLVITYALELCDIYLNCFNSHLFCILIQTEFINWVPILASKVNLAFVTIDRYLTVVHPAWSKKKLRDWMIYLAMASAWISGFIHMSLTTFPTTDFIDGVCLLFEFFDSSGFLSWLANGICFFLYFYVIIFIIFIFCYWRILAVVRRQARVMAAHNAAGSSTSQTQSNQIQTNVIKTMIVVSASFAICDLPVNVYFMLRSTILTSANYAAYYATLFMSFLYICANPFIYATKFDPVKRVLLDLIPCKKTPVQPIQHIDLTPPGVAANRQC